MGTSLTNERMKYLLDRLIDHESVGRNCQDTIKLLLSIGFTGEELNTYFSFNAQDIKYAEKYA